MGPVQSVAEPCDGCSLCCRNVYRRVSGVIIQNRLARKSSERCGMKDGRRMLRRREVFVALRGDHVYEALYDEYFRQMQSDDRDQSGDVESTNGRNHFAQRV